jgi:hypothetical protein
VIAPRASRSLTPRDCRGSLSGIVLGLIVLASICGSACLPVKTSQQTRVIGGQTAKTVDFKFLTVGSSSRAEIDEKLGWVDSGFKNQRLFWARYFEANWKLVGAYRSPASQFDDTLQWHERNLMIELDENGSAKRWELVSDKQLAAWLLSWAARSKQPRFAAADKATCPAAEMFTDFPGSGGQYRDIPLEVTAKIQPDCRQIRKVELKRPIVLQGSWAVWDPDPTKFHVVLHLKERFQDHEKLYLRVDATSLYAFVRSQNAKP